jgi:hypothetical protein
MTQTMTTTDLLDTLTLTEYPWYADRRGRPTLDLPDEETTVHVVEEDGTFYVTTLTGGRARLIADEVRISGVHAVAILLSVVDAIVADAR